MSAAFSLRVVPAAISLEPALSRLAVDRTQRPFVGRISDLLADARNRPGCEPMAILRDHQPIGFYCIETVARCIAGRDFDQPALGLRGFAIDAAWQGRGLGRQALALLLADLATRHQQARLLVLTVHASNPRALALYRGAGFVDSGERYDGGPSGVQHLLWRALPGSGALHAW